MLEDQRPGTVYWIDHYVVPTADTARWSEFYTRVLGAEPRVPAAGPDRGGRPATTLFTWVARCHVGGSSYGRALPPGTGFPRYSWFIRPEDVDEHLRRLDRNGVAHTGPIRTTEEGEEGAAIRFADPDDNQLEFWAPARMPQGAMEGETSAKVGCISTAAFESRDLARTADFYSQYCGLDPLQSADVPKDTIVFPLAAAGRLVFKQVDRLGNRTTGHAVFRALHTAFIVRDDDFMPAMERMWNELPEWDFDPEAMPNLSAEEAGALTARTCIHGSPIGPEWKRVMGRGDSFADWDTNVYHFVAGAPVDGSMVSYTGVAQSAFMKGPKL
jgi:catechol 2,3-dioxygenase-like lactoylglutathione lyase family enzyme